MLFATYLVGAHGDPPLPTYGAYHEFERALPQHTRRPLAPEDETPLPLPKMLWFDNHGSRFGWGNYMQEMVLNAYLAYAADRAYVFDNYTWDREGPEVSQWHGKKIPARIPLSATITGESSSPTNLSFEAYPA
uniref:Uncharacterized protein n=1 Tax=Mycena chlorophos TaxID=658473 RepID=A0ABQ0LXZ3_MYCCL|nr:predicted protein [Mycena chlorophos]